MENNMYYIQSGYVGNAILWWAKDSKGYTTDIRLAGKYTKEEAESITQRPQDIAWECTYVDEMIDTEGKKLIIDGQYLDKTSGKVIIGKLK